MIELDKELSIQYIDASSISTFMRCPAKYVLSRHLALELPETSLMAPDFGTDIHKAVPYCYGSEEDFTTGFAIFKSSWQARKYEEDDKRNMLRAYQMLQNFRSIRSNSSCPYEIIKLDFDAPTTELISPNEVPFLIDIGCDLPAAGRLDAAVRWRSTKQLFALDYKTTGEISPRLFKNFHFSPQACLYTLALSTISREPANGIIIEAIRVSPKNDEVQLSFIFVTDIQIQSFLNLCRFVVQSIMHFNKEKRWPKQCTGCGSYSMFGFPGFTCPYEHICMQKDWRDGAKIYKQGTPWHPFSIEGGD